MKKRFGKVLLGVVGVVGLLVAGVLGRFYGMFPKIRAAQAMSAPTSPEALARGAYLVNHVAACLGCHSEVQSTVPGEPVVPGTEGAGRVFNDPSFPGALRSTNITPDPETGIGNWSDGEIVRAIREGVSKNGRPLVSMMPYQVYGKNLSDEDALAIVAYLRTLKPIRKASLPAKAEFPVSMFMREMPAPVVTPIPPAPAPTDKKARGEWLLQMASCHDCHDTVNDRHETVGKPFGGGFAFYAGSKGVVRAPNISSDPATGIGAYSEADLRRALEDGIGKSGRKLYVMPWSYYKGLTAEDKDALVSALKAAPPIVNMVPANTAQ